MDTETAYQLLKDLNDDPPQRTPITPRERFDVMILTILQDQKAEIKKLRARLRALESFVGGGGS